MAIPHAVLAAGWVPFVIVLVLTLVFSFVYVRYFQHRYDSELSSTIVSILGLTVSILTVALVPVDIFLVSYMKNPNGTFKVWATNTSRSEIENAVLYGYYALYSCVMVFVFFILPFTYFYYEEGGEGTNRKSRCCSALKFTIVFIFMAGVLLIVGAFAPLKSFPNSTSTNWHDIEYLFKGFANNNGEDALSFSISSLTLVGMIALIVYTGYGMSAWPMDLVKGRRSVSKEMSEVNAERAEVESQIQAIKDRYQSGRRYSSRDRQKLEDLEEQIDVMGRRERHLQQVYRSWLRKCGVLLRPFMILMGVLCFLMGLLVFISLLLTNIDKVMHSDGWRMGYSLPQRHLPNPIDITLVLAQQVFPIDYILVGALVLYFIFCTMGGIQHIGICCFCIRMYKIRIRRTKPQGLLFLCFILMFIVLSLNVVLYQLTPQYSMFGSQHYQSWDNTTMKIVPKPCSIKAPHEECVMTRMGWLLMRFFYKVWFFGACYFYASWAFLGVFVVGFIISFIRKRRSSIEGAVDKDDFDDSDDELLPP